MKRPAWVFLTCMMAFSLADSAMAGLITDTITVDYRFPNTGAIVHGPVNTVVTADSTDNVTFDLGFFDIAADPGDNGFAITLPGATSGMSFTSATFSGIFFTDLDLQPSSSTITGVTLDTNIPGLDASRVSFTSDSVAVDFQGLSTTNALDFVNLTLQTTAAVPEPTSIAVFGVCGGVAAIATARRRRRERRCGKT